MRVKLMTLTADGPRDIVHELDSETETACLKLARPAEHWEDDYTDEPVDCPICIRRLAARAA
jgi:hypothetical protein